MLKTVVPKLFFYFPYTASDVLSDDIQLLTSWLVELGGSMPNSQGLSNNSYPEPNQPSLIPISSRSILILSSHQRLGLPKGLFPVSLPCKILKALLPSCILATCPVHLNLLDLINLTILDERYKV